VEVANAAIEVAFAAPIPEERGETPIVLSIITFINIVIRQIIASENNNITRGGLDFDCMELSNN